LGRYGVNRAKEFSWHCTLFKGGHPVNGSHSAQSLLILEKYVTVVYNDNHHNATCFAIITNQSAGKKDDRLAAALKFSASAAFLV
jgi:hypothetical protein